jgi:uncharacterized membrane protein YjjP (DUF1212 family)
MKSDKHRCRNCHGSAMGCSFFVYLEKGREWLVRVVAFFRGALGELLRSQGILKGLGGTGVRKG